MRFALLAGLFLVSGWLCAENPPVALPNGSTAPNFTLTDLDGVSHTLYDYLDQGKTVVIDFSATWCGPCWNYHNTHILNDLYDQYGPDGTDEVMVFFVEGDPSTPVSSLYGGPGSQGNWVAGTSYPIMDDPTGSVASAYSISYFPTLYAICPNRKVYEPGQVSLQSWVNWISSCSLDESHLTADANCFGEASGSIDLSVTGGYGGISYHWSNGTTTQDLSNISPGTYACTITEGQGHSIETPTMTVGAPSLLVPQTNFVIDVLCAGEATGTAAVTAVGGTPGYLFQWSNGISGQVISNVSGGNYVVTVTDNHGCQATHTLAVGEPAPLQVTPQATSANCGNSDGILLVTVQGGTYPYLYDIGKGPQPNPLFLNLSAGD
ncbi:MAG: redoxin family protein, partial [Phaeodactylibacter sp.]|nr:redoxin family protein [Phaeodactylibacter sp.]